MKTLKKIKKKYLVLTGVGVIAIFLVFAGLKKQNDDLYSSFTVEKTTVSDTLLLAGTIDAKDRVDLGFATSGRVKKVNFQVGDSVKKGQIIAEVEQNRLASELTQARANYTVTRVDTNSEVQTAADDLETIIAEQDSIVNGLYQQYLTGDLQAYNLDSDSSRTAPSISGNYQATQEGEYLLDMYSSNANSGYSFRLSGLESGTYTAEVNNPGKLGTKGLFIQFSSGNNYNNTEWVIPVPNTRSTTYAQRKTAYENALATRNRVIASAKNNVNRVSGSDTQSEITRDEARRAQAAAQVSAVVSQLGDGKIRAPFDGIIAKNDLEIGEIVNAFSTEIIMFAGQEKELNLNTPEIYINKIAVGDSVDVTLDAYDDISLTGTVEFIDFIDTEVDGVPVYKTDIVIDTIDERIRSGMNAKASIISDQRSDVLAIPAHYIDTDTNGIQTVMLRVNEQSNETTVQIVETGLRGNEGLVEIINGLKAGDVILLENK